MKKAPALRKENGRPTKPDQKISFNAICICRDEFDTAVMRPNVPAPTVTFGFAKYGEFERL